MTPGATGARNVDLIVFSPHLDDAALSCGGRIAAATRAGASVLVVTSFSGNPAMEGRRAGGTLSAFAGMNARREEDRAAMARLGSVPVWLGHEEAIGRDRRYRSFPGMMGRIRGTDGPLLRTLEETLHGFCRQNPGASLLFPLGIGGHVDHRILFEVSRRLVAMGVAPGRFAYFEEIPYAFVPFLVEHRLAQAGVRLPFSAMPPDLSPAASIFSVARRAVNGVLAVPIIRAEIRPFQKPLLRALMALLVARRRLRLSTPGRTEALRLHPEVLDITEYARLKEEAITFYNSQLPALFDSADAWRYAALSYAARIGALSGHHAERYWVPVN